MEIIPLCFFFLNYVSPILFWNHITRSDKKTTMQTPSRKRKQYINPKAKLKRGLKSTGYTAFRCLARVSDYCQQQ